MNSKFKKIMAFFLTLILAVSALNLTAFADYTIGENPYLYVEYYPYYYNFSGSGLGTSMYGQIVKLNKDNKSGDIAYCIDSRTSSGNGGSKYLYTASSFSNYIGLSDTQQREINHAFMYGYLGSTKYGYSADEERIATQIVIWNICDGWFNNSSETTALNCFTADMSSTVKANVKACYNKIKVQILNHLTKPSYAGTSKQMKLGTDGTYSITISDSNGVTSFFDWKSVAAKYSYLSITSQTATSITIKSTKAITTTLSLKANKTKNTYCTYIDNVQPIALIAKAGATVQQTAVGYQGNMDPVTATLSLTTQPVGNLTLTKSYDPAGSSTLTTAEKTALFSTVQFTIKNSSGQYIKKGGNKTDGYNYAGVSATDLGSNTLTRFYLNTSTGKQTISDLPTGTYTVTEIVGNTGFTATPKTRTITVSQNATTSASFTNAENVGNLSIGKTYSQKDTLTATEKAELFGKVQFTIQNSDGDFVKKNGNKTDGYGYAGVSSTDLGSNTLTRFYLNTSTGKQTISDLPVGTYTIKEVVGNTGYTVNKTSAKITVTKGGNVSTTFTNTQDTGSLQVTKTYVQTDTLTTEQRASLLSKVRFTIKNADGKYVKATGSASAGYVYAGTSTTKVNFAVNPMTGYSNISGLPVNDGAFTVSESIGNTGYTVNKTSATITVSKGGNVSTTFTNTQNTGTMTFAKKFRDTDRKTIVPNVAQITDSSAKYTTVDGQLYSYSAFHIYFTVQDASGKYVVHGGNRTDGYTYAGTSSTDLGAGTTTSFYLNVTNASSLKMVISDLPVGTYYVTEQVGYCDKATDTIFKFSAESDSLTVVNNGNKTYTKYNDQETTYNGNIEIQKQFFDITGTGTENVTATTTAKSQVRFKLSYVEDGETFYCSFKKIVNGIYEYSGVSSAGTEMVLASDGTINISGLPNYNADGIEFTAEESTNNSVYKLNTAKSSFNVTIPQNDSGKKTIKIVNEVNLGTLKINKILKNADGTTMPSGSIFSTIKFKVADENGEWLIFDSAKNYTGTTSDESLATALQLSATTTSITVYKLPYGEYSVYEKQGAVGYAFDSDTAEIATINSINTVPVTFTNEQETGELLVQKLFQDVDGENITEISDLATQIEFNVTVGGKYVTANLTDTGIYTYTGLTTNSTSGTTFKLDLDGFINIRNCPPETYAITEKKGATGFAFETTAKNISLFANQTNKVLFTNKAMAGNLTITKRSDDGVVEGFSFRVTGTALTGQEYDETFVTNSLGKISISNLRIGIYTIEEVINGKTVGYITPDEQTIEVAYGETTNVYMKNVPIGNVHVTKVDNDYPANKLTGAEFTVYKSDKTTVVGKLTETTTGEYQLDDLVYGEYFIKETKAPANYVLDNNFYAFSITTAGATVKVETKAGVGFENAAMTGNITIQKQSADSILSGWKFRITGTALTGQSYDKTFTTNAQGKISVTGLRIGNYKVEEITTGIVGYITPSAQNTTVTFGKTSALTFTNTPIGNVHVTKIDKDYPTNKLTGAEFTVYKSDKTTFVGKLTETTTGEYQLDDLVYGEYFIKETKAPTNYVLDNNFYAFSITAAGATVKVETKAGVGFENAAMTGNITIQKQSADNVLSGWKFRITGTALTGQSYDKTFTTNAQGKISVTGLRIGNYKVEEITTGIVGYITPSAQNTTVTFGKTSALTFINTPIGNVHVTKVDKDYPTNKLTGAEFTVYKSDKTTVVGKLSEITTGEYQLNDLVYGNYYLQETKAPTNYVLDNNFYPFAITTAGATVKVETKAGVGFENTAMTGNITIQKQSADSILSDWKFRITGTALTGQSYDKTFTTNAQGKISVTGLRIGNYKVEEVTTGIVGYITPSAQNTTVTFGKTSALTFTNTPIGNVHVTKIDKDYTTNKLTGAEFTVYKSDKTTVVGKLTETTTGEYQLDDLVYGEYFIKETKAPTNYVLDNNFYAFSITTAGATVKVETKAGIGFENTAMTGNITIQKQSADNVLSGWKFRITGTALTGQSYDKTFTTNAQGKISVTGLRIGSYKVQEITTGIVGYITPSAQNTTVTFDKTSALTFINTPIGNVHVTKIDKDYPANKLTGAEFTVYKSDKTTVVGKLTETTTGEYQLNDLVYGNYFIKETKAPTNYVLDNNFYPFAITTAGATVKVETKAGVGFENAAMTGNIQIVKTSTNGIVEGFSFTVTGTALTGQSYNNTFVTDKNGVINITGLRVGTYKVSEVINNKTIGYITPSAQTITVTTDNTTTVKMQNTRITGKFKLTKVDKDNISKILPNTEYTIYVDKNGNGKYDSATDVEYGKLTDTNGVYTMDNIDYGTYLIKETKAPAGYKIDNNYYAFSIKTNGQQATVTNSDKTVDFVEEPMKGNIEIIKTSTNGIVDGFSFTVTGTAITGEKYNQTFVTDKNGVINITGLRIGTYTVSEVINNKTIGYITPSAQTITVTTDNTTTVKMQNIRITGSVKVTKVDEDYQDELLSGAEFTVYATDKKTVIGMLSEISKGVYQLDNIDYGTYLLKETKAPQYFVADDNFYPFTISENGKVVEVGNNDNNFTNTAELGAIQVAKTSSDGRKQGFTFNVAGTDYTGHEYSENFVTDENGMINVTDLRVGKYTVSEVENAVSKGYEIPDDMTVEVSYNGTKTVKMYNAKFENPNTGEAPHINWTMIIAIIAIVGGGTGITLSQIKRNRKKK